MKVNLKCFANLVDHVKCNFNESTTYELDDGKTVGDLVEFAGISSNDVKIAFVNSRVVEFDTVLSNGDKVGLAPIVGGM